MSQPFALFVKNLFEEQVYPDLTKYPDAWQGLVSPQKFKDAYLPPYDIAGGRCPTRWASRSRPANTPLDGAADADREGDRRRARSKGPRAPTYLISPKTNNSFIAVNRVLKQGGEVSRAREAFTAGSGLLSAGHVHRHARADAASAADALAKELGLTIARRASRRQPAKASKLRAPRVALYRSWTAQMDEGWTRFLFDQFEFAFTNVQDPGDARRAISSENFDVLVIPSMSTDAIVDGLKIGTVPPQYAGGITADGVRNIKSFVESGGTLVLLNKATLFAIDRLEVAGHRRAEGVQAARPTRRRRGEDGRFACPGSVLRMEFDPKHPVAYGMPEKAPGMFIQSPAFRFNPSFGDKGPVTIAKYPREDILMSGYLKGEKYLKNAVAAAEVPLGKGRVILLGFGVEQRGQPHGTFKLLFNSLYYATMGEGAPASAARAK